ncbi:MAG TPA: ATP-binding protein, partial [Pyrinomonadaceae bacterium]|nr:ATP-binding protein [Pyrinomonadaceae bacterium]
IEVAARGAGGRLVLSVSDNGPGYNPGAGTGVGLANTRARLETLFGERGQLGVVRAKGGGTVATVAFPLRRREDG